MYQNGFFEFNITKMIEYIQKHSGDIKLETVAVEDFLITKKGYEAYIEYWNDKLKQQ